MDIKDTFRKQGGMKLITQYMRSGCLGVAIGEFALLGKSRTALELLRLSTQLKVKKKLERKYNRYIDEFILKYDDSIKAVSSKTIWICWFQGLDNAPELVQKCFKSIKDRIKNREIVLITSDNMYDYVSFPDYIQKKIDLGIISNAHLADLLRLELLLKYGGTWIDATVFCSNDNIPDYMLNSELFMFQCLKPGRDGHSTVVSNWFITSEPNNKLLFMVKELLYAYWEKNDHLLDYFIFHVFFQICIERFPDEWNKVIPFSNSTPHILLLRLYDEYDEATWQAINSQTPFHKLSYKLENKDYKNSYYERIVKTY